MHIPDSVDRVAAAMVNISMHVVIVSLLSLVRLFMRGC